MLNPVSLLSPSIHRNSLDAAHHSLKPVSALARSFMALAYPFALSPAFFIPLTWPYNIAAGHGLAAMFNRVVFPIVVVGLCIRDDESTDFAEGMRRKGVFVVSPNDIPLVGKEPGVMGPLSTSAA